MAAVTSATVPSKIDLTDAFRYAISRTGTRGGAILVVAYVVLQLATQVTVQSLVAKAIGDRLPTEAGRQVYPLAVDLPVAVSGLLTAGLLLGGTMLVVIAMRAFYRDINAVPTPEHTRLLPRTIAVTLAVSIIVSLAVMIGSMLLFIPGIFLAVSLVFAVLVVAIEDTGVVEALKRSWELSSGNRIRLFALGVALVMLGIAFSVPLAVLQFVSPAASDVGGAVLSAVLGMFGIALLVGAYRQLTGNNTGSSPMATSKAF